MQQSFMEYEPCSVAAWNCDWWGLDCVVRLGCTTTRTRTTFWNEEDETENQRVCGHGVENKAAAVHGRMRDDHSFTEASMSCLNAGSWMRSFARVRSTKTITHDRSRGAQLWEPNYQKTRIRIGTDGKLTTGCWKSSGCANTYSIRTRSILCWSFSALSLAAAV